MAKIDKVEKFLKEEKPKKIKDLEVGFDNRYLVCSSLIFV